MATIRRITILAALVTLTSCARTEEPVATQATAQMPDHSCPMMVEGTEVSVVDTETGVGMVFTTAGDVAALRERVQRMAAMHRQMSGDMAGHEQMGHEAMAMPEADVEVRAVERGALLHLTPRDPAQLANLRQHARTHADQMASGRCPMMEHRMPMGT